MQLCGLGCHKHLCQPHKSLNTIILSISMINYIKHQWIVGTVLNIFFHSAITFSPAKLNPRKD